MDDCNNGDDEHRPGAQSDEDFVLSDGDVESHSLDDEDSGSDYDGGRQRGRSSKQSRKKEKERVRIETTMTKKLRSAGPTPEEVEEQERQQRMREEKLRAKARAGTTQDGGEREEDNGEREEDNGEDGRSEDSEGPSSSELSSAEPEPAPTRPPLTPEQAKGDLEAVRSMWEFASIAEFLFRFRYYLQLHVVPTVDKLAEAIVHSSGERVNWCFQTFGLQCPYLHCPRVFPFAPQDLAFWLSCTSIC